MTPVSLKNLIAKVNGSTRAALEQAAGLTVSHTHFDVVPAHYLLKLLEDQGGDFACIARHFAIDSSRLSLELGSALDRLRRGNSRTPALSQDLVRMLTEAWVLASINYNEPAIRTGHTILALVSLPDFSAIELDVPQLRRVKPAELAANFLSITNSSSESAIEAPRQTPSMESRSSTAFFVSYRRRDSGHSAGRIHDRLVAAFGPDRVFMDVSDLKPGELYTLVLIDAISRSDIVLVVIGKNWNRKMSREGRRQLDDPEDWVRLEIATALEKGKRIIPCVVDGAKAPRVDDLPPTLADLARRQVVEISQHQFDRDISGLVDLLKRAGATSAASPA